MQKLNETIQIRYTKEATTCCSLSCGNALDYAKLQTGETVVDLGSGRGLDVIKATRFTGNEGKSYGIDFTQAMIEAAETNKKKLKIKNAYFLLGSIDKIPLEDNFADAVISNCTINHAKDKSLVYQEIRRILKPGGRFIVSDVIATKELPAEVINDPAAWAACYGGAITEEDYFRSIAKAGFQSIDVIEKSEPYEKGGVLVSSITIRGIKE